MPAARASEGDTASRPIAVSSTAARRTALLAPIACRAAVAMLGMVVALTAGSCSRRGGPPRRPPLPPGQAEAGGPAFLPSTTVVDEPAAAAGMPATVIAVRSAAHLGLHEGFDRVTIELAGSAPGYRAAWRTTPPRRCGSGAAVAMAGSAWLEVRLDPAQAHDAEGRVTLEARPQQPPGLSAIHGLEMTCDFEGVVSWALGAPRALPFRVMPLSDPPRVVVDVAHATAAAASP